MGRAVLLLIAGASLIVSIVTVNINSSIAGMYDTSFTEYQQSQARNNANSGLEYAIRKLVDDTTWTGVNNKVLSNGKVTIAVQSSVSKYFNGANNNLLRGRLITAVGSVGNFVDTIRAVVQITSSAGSASVPGFLEYAVASGNTLTMNGNINITDDGNDDWNANMHSNSNFQMNGNNSIDGFLTYVGTAHSNPGTGLNNNFHPNVNPNNLAVHRQVSTVTIPTFDPDTYKSKADVVYSSNKIVTGNITLGTKDNPQIIYVGGDLNINGNVTGYGVFIVKGNINLNGNVTINSLDPNCSNLGLYTKGDLNCNGNITLKAQILTNGNANLGGNVNIYGSLTTRSTINFNGNVKVYYRPANVKLTEDFWTGTVVAGTGRPSIISVWD